MSFFFAFPSSFDLYPFSFSPPVSTSTIRLSDLTHDIVELSPYAETTITLEKKNVFGILHLVVIKSEFFFAKGIK